jgi:hypothetical protein
MPNLDRQYDRFLERSRALTATPPPDRVQQTQTVIKTQIQSTVSKPLYSFIGVLCVVSVYLAYKRPSFVMRAVLPDYSSYGLYGTGYTVPPGTVYRRFDYPSWIKASFCLALLIWAVMYLLMGALSTSQGFDQGTGESGCEGEPDSAGYCSS